MSNNELGPQSPADRSKTAEDIRIQAAASRAGVPSEPHCGNGDDAGYASLSHYASYSKGLRHNERGEVDDESYASMIKALSSGKPDDFDRIILGAPDGQSVKLTNPQAGLAFDLEGIDGHQLTMKPAPKFNSKEAIGEIAENYWLALCRDIPFSAYDHHPLIARAAADLSSYDTFRGAKGADGRVAPATLFRDTAPGAKAGPYLSQFMIHDVPYGSQRTSARIAYGFPDNMDFMTDEASWLAVQNGCKTGMDPAPLAEARIMHDGRSLGSYVHIDELFQGYLNACLLMITPKLRGGFGVPPTPGNPYVNNRTQVGFGTLGEPNFKVLVAEVATRALKAVWFQKWYVHRRIRPEVFAGRIHYHMKGAAHYDFDLAELAKLQAGPLAHPRIAASKAFLPMAFPEGSPTHPAYGAGHATVAGACVTVLKALFNTEATFADLNVPVMQPDAGGHVLTPYQGSDWDQLTVGGELDKLAANIGLARNFAGVHWRSDYTESVRLGERIAYAFLQETVDTYNEDVTFSWLTLDDVPMSVSKQRAAPRSAPIAEIGAPAREVVAA